MTRPRSSPRIQTGFTLTELAIVMLIVALLIGGLLVPLSAQVDLQRGTETQKGLAEIREALVGYAASHTATDGKPYLPCPDTNNDGSENRAAGACTNQEGNVPWVDLGVGQMDAWNNRFRYRVNANFSNSTTGFTLASASDIRVCDAAGCATLISNNLAAVILSHGKNGAGAVNLSGGANPAPSAGQPDELANTNGDKDFVSHTPTDSGAANGEFDDIVAWLPASILFGRMVAAGKLP